MANPSVLINGSVYPSVPFIETPKQGGGTAQFHYTEDASAGAEHILAGKTAFGSGGSINGSMANNGDTSGTISTKAGTVTIPAGHTSGGTVKIADAEQAKIIADNIKANITILGQQGKSTVVDTTISSDAAAAGTIVSGKKAYVNGSLITGNLSTPTITQDSTTKVLSIS